MWLRCSEGTVMSEKESKKFRKQTRKAVDNLSHGIMGKTTFQIARQRDIIFIITIFQTIVIIILTILLIWRCLNG